MNKAMIGMVDDSDLMKLVSEAGEEPPLDVTEVVHRWRTRKAMASEPLTLEQLSTVVETARRAMTHTPPPSRADFLAAIRRCLISS
jgi:hypothetical protein